MVLFRCAIFLTLASVLAACQTPAQPRKATTVKPASSAKPGVAASVKPSSAPLGPTTTLKGRVSIDAHYLLANHAGSLISTNGREAIALQAGTLISDNGLGLLSDNGLGLLSDNGLGLIKHDGAGYRTLAAASVPIGTVLPVKGMAVFPISLRTGAVVGKPVFTDEQGAYTLDVPESVKGNLRLVARVAVKDASDPIAADPRAQYNLVVDAAGTATAIDEDTSVATRYVRACFANRVREILVTTDPDGAAELVVHSLGFDASLKSFLSGTVKEVNTAAREAGVPAMAPDRIDALAQRMTDVLLSYVALESIEIDPAKYGKTGPKEPALAGFVDVVARLREVAAKRMQDDPQAFENAAWMQGVEYPRAIKKPSDVCDFVVDNYLLSLHASVVNTSVGLSSAGMADPSTQAKRINALAIGILATVGQTMLSTPEAKGQLMDVVRAAKN